MFRLGPKALSRNGPGKPASLVAALGGVRSSGAALWNALDKHDDITLSGGSLVATSSATANRSVRATNYALTGNRVYEATVVTLGAGTYSMGLGFANRLYSLGNDPKISVSAVIWFQNGEVWFNSSSIGTAASYTTGDILTLEIRSIHGSPTFFGRVNGGSWNNNAANPATGVGGFAITASFSTIAGVLFPLFHSKVSGNSAKANFGQVAYGNATPGFKNFASKTFFYVAQGDSITASDTSDHAYPGRYQVASIPSTDVSTTVVTTYAVGGYRISNLVSQQSTIIAAKPADLAGQSVLSILIGVNDYINGMSATDFLAAYAAHCDVMRAAGFRLIVSTLTPTLLGGGWPAWRDIVNPEIRLWATGGSIVSGVHADRICDFAADPVMGVDAAASDTSLYSDGVHPTSGAGQVGMLNVVSPVIDSFRTTSAPVNTMPPEITGTAQVGNTLTVSNGEWDNVPTGYTYSWYRSGVVISGETGSTYLLALADVGATIKARVTASNATGSASQDSGATATVPAAPTYATVWADRGTGMTLSASDAVVTGASGAWAWARGSVGFTGEDRYFELQPSGSINVSQVAFGVIDGTSATGSGLLGTGPAKSAGTRSTDNLLNGFTQGQAGGTGTDGASGRVIGVAVKGSTGQVFLSYQGVWINSSDPVAGTNPQFTWTGSRTIYPGVGIFTTNAVRLVARNFTYSPPTGFVGWDS